MDEEHTVLATTATECPIVEWRAVLADPTYIHIAPYRDIRHLQL